MLADDLILALRVVDADAAARDDAQAVLRLEAQARSAERNITPLICAPASFSVKYRCPVFQTRQFEISPSTQTSTNALLEQRRGSRPVSSVTVQDAPRRGRARRGRSARAASGSSNGRSNSERHAIACRLLDRQVDGELVEFLLPNS